MLWDSAAGFLCSSQNGAIRWLYAICVNALDCKRPRGKDRREEKERKVLIDASSLVIMQELSF
jgi:hypothetical protein